MIIDPTINKRNDNFIEGLKSESSSSASYYAKGSGQLQK